MGILPMFPRAGSTCHLVEGLSDLNGRCGCDAAALLTYGAWVYEIAAVA